MEIQTLYFGGNEANCYLVLTDSAALVIDPAAPFVEAQRFLSENSDKERLILLTHFHFDHILGAKELRDKFGAKIVIGAMDEVGLYNDRFSLSALVGLSQEPFYADVKVEDGDIIEIREDKIEVLYTPGHTAGSVCYRLGENLFTGDTLFEYSVGRTDFPTGDSAALTESLKRLAEIEENLILYPGHGDSTTLLKEKLHNPYMQDLSDYI